MNELRNLLRLHDPARGSTLADADRRRLRTAMLAAHAEPARRPLLRFAAATAMSLVVLLTLSFAVLRVRDAAPPEKRRVEYVTPGGTRVIWTLDPAFDL